MKKYIIALPIVVEGKYDKNTLSQIFDATIIYIGGFSVFNSKEKQALIRKIAVDGIILLTDSDGGGKQIRSFLNGILPREKVHNVYIPQVKGKEKRKSAPSKAGTLGVEGMDRDTLVRVLSPFTLNMDENADTPTRVDFSDAKERKMTTKLNFFEDGLSGSDGAAERRSRLAAYFGLPTDMTANALLEALNIITDYDGYSAAVNELFGGE